MYQQRIDLSDKKGDVRIVFIGDEHIGCKGFRPDIFEKALAELEDENTYWIGLGDQVEGRSPKHKFYCADETEMDVQEQYEYFFDKVRPYMDRCLGLHLGNHEASITRETTVNPLKTFSFEHKVPYLGGVAITIFKRGDKEYRLCTSHGAGGALKVGASINKITDYLLNFDADAVCVGHYHKLCHNIGEKPVVNEVGKYGWKPTDIILNGSMLQTYTEGNTSYAESGLMPPTALGYSILWLDEDLNPQVTLVPVR